MALWLLGLLALAAIAAVLAGTLSGNDGDDRSTGQTQPQNGDSGTGTAAGQGTGAAGGTPDGAQLTADGASLLPAPSGGLSSHVGQTARGTNLRVLTVVSNAE